MRWGFALVLGLIIAVPATAQASRQDQGARSQSARTAPAAQARPPAARQAATPARQSAARPAVAPARSAAAASPIRLVAHTRAVPARQSDARSSTAFRTAVPYGHGARAAVQLRDRSGRVIADPAAMRSVVRGQSARFAQRCTVTNGRRSCTAARQVAFRWQGGLNTASGSQSQCPDGTMAMLALGHENVYRCVPF